MIADFTLPPTHAVFCTRRTVSRPTPSPAHWLYQPWPTGSTNRHVPHQLTVSLASQTNLASAPTYRHIYIARVSSHRFALCRSRSA